MKLTENKSNGVLAYMLLHMSLSDSCFHLLQKLSGRSISPGLQMFGQSISGNVDMDGNGYAGMFRPDKMETEKISETWDEIIQKERLRLCIPGSFSRNGKHPCSRYFVYSIPQLTFRPSQSSVHCSGLKGVKSSAIRCCCIIIIITLQISQTYVFVADVIIGAFMANSVVLLRWVNRSFFVTMRSYFLPLSHF